MRKYQTVLHEVTRPQRGKPWAGRVLLLALILLVSPVVYEGALVVYGQWQSMAGSYYEPKTPVLDAAREWCRSADVDLRYRAGRVFSGEGWSPTLLVPVALGWAAAMAFVFLRRVRY